MKKLALALLSGATALTLLNFSHILPVSGQDGEAPGSEAEQMTAGPEQPAEAAQAKVKKPVWHDVTTGFELAQKENKPIIADFYTDWCGWCKVMERETFNNADVIKVMAPKFILVRVNAEDGKAGEALARKHKIRGYPTIMFFAPDGSLKSTLIGYQKAPEFIQKVNAFLEGKDISEQ